MLSTTLSTMLSTRDQDQGSGSRIRIKDKDQGSRFLLILTVATSIVRPLVAMFLVKPQAQVYARCCCGHLIIFLPGALFHTKDVTIFGLLDPSRVSISTQMSHVRQLSK